MKEVLKYIRYFALLLSCMLIAGCGNKSVIHVKDITDKSLAVEVVKDQDLSGIVVKVIDGDTYDLRTERGTVRIRMEGIDAPERGMPYYKAATRYLASLCDGQTLTIKPTSNDKYDRLLTYSYLPDGRELSHEMLKAGLAWHFTKYNSDSKLAALEKEARKARRGLWQDEPMAPWEVRKLRRQGTSTKEMFNITSENE